MTDSSPKTPEKPELWLVMYKNWLFWLGKSPSHLVVCSWQSGTTWIYHQGFHEVKDSNICWRLYVLWFITGVQLSQHHIPDFKQVRPLVHLLENVQWYDNADSLTHTMNTRLTASKQINFLSGIWVFDHRLVMSTWEAMLHFQHAMAHRTTGRHPWLFSHRRTETRLDYQFQGSISHRQLYHQLCSQWQRPGHLWPSYWVSLHDSGGET